MERHGLHAMPELLGVPFALHRALAAKPPRAPPFSHEVGGPGFGYAAHELFTTVNTYSSRGVLHVPNAKRNRKPNRTARMPREPPSRELLWLVQRG